MLKRFVIALLCFNAFISTSFALEVFPITNTKFTGDLTQISEHGVIRILVSADLGFYYLDKGHPKGITSEMLLLFEQHVLTSTKQKLHLQIIPINRDQLLPALQAGVGDIVAANLTITRQRKKTVDFSSPILSNINEIFITHADKNPITQLKDLSKKNVWIRASSSYYRSVNRINKKLAKQGLETMYVHFIEETLQDYELLQMIQQKIIPMTVLDNHKAEFWDLVTDDLIMHTDFPIRKGGAIGWAFRKDSPELAELVNNFIEKNRYGTLNGNIIFNRYLNSKAWFQKVVSATNIAKFKKLEKRFVRYSNMYDMNWLLIAAQAFQESQFDQTKRSHAGAVGIMQVLPQTAKEPYINISNIYNIDNNIHAGVKYMDFILNRYYDTDDIDDMNKMFFALASYNAGPGRINRMRRLAKEQGYDSTKWFNNVEVITRKHVGIEPITYVGNINRYYTVYKQIFSLQNATSQQAALRHKDYLFIPSH
ncbi:MAG: lytic transglycosylase F [Photobacterium frigidiphilum]|uniref:transglycosylase SLT domain-containing protein n=1 Tax=Photobacterium frigidiphilum TaxID=264736 RepID=UPI0030031247